MGLIAALAVLRAHVLVVAVPGRPLLRLRAEAAVRARGWVLAASPADADLLLVCGSPEGELADAVARVWDQVPFPRARRTVTAADGIEEALDGAARALGDDALQRRAAASVHRSGDPASAAMPDPRIGEHGHEEHADQHRAGTHHAEPREAGAHERDDHARDVEEHDRSGHGDDAHDHGVQDHDAQDVHGHGHGHGDDVHDHDMHGHDVHGHDVHDHAMQGHGGHDHMHMDMTGPGGVPLAGGSEDDRDGLEMDVLHLPLGPVLPLWPAGLVVDLVLSGDVVLSAEARLLPAADADPDDLDEATRRAVLELDRAATLLTLLGMPAPAGRAQRAIARLLTGDEPGRVLPGVRALGRRLRRSGTLRWGLAQEGDVLARLDALLQQDPAHPASEADPAELAASLTGRTLASVRLRVAAAAPVPEPAHA